MGMITRSMTHKWGHTMIRHIELQAGAETRLQVLRSKYKVAVYCQAPEPEISLLRFKIEEAKKTVKFWQSQISRNRRIFEEMSTQ